MLAFTHIPKTAGSSLRSALKEVYGSRLVLDYETRPREISPWRRKVNAVLRRLRAPRAQVIYGHFPLGKYRGLARHFGAFFRDPTNRTMSDYFYSQHTHIEPLVYVSRPKAVRFYEFFLGGLPIERLDFVGITEEYDLPCRLFEAIFGRRLSRYRERVGSNLDYRRWLQERGCLEAACQAQSINRQIYDAARRRFDSLCQRYL